MTRDTRRTTVEEIDSLEPGDEWPFHYRGYGLSVNADGDVWWQAYNGTDRLEISPVPDEVVGDLLEMKRRGGSIRLTESGAVITRVENDGSDEYETVFVGQFGVEPELVPPDDPTRKLPLSPDGLTPGDLWESVYDGSVYSFSGNRFWWHDPESKLRHPFDSPFPESITDDLRRLRTNGGRFVITPGGDVVTQIPTAETPKDVRSQFRELPRVVKRLLQLRRERGNVDMIPVYVGELDSTALPIEVEEPTRLTDPLSDQEEQSLESWVAAMGSYEEDELTEEDHIFDGGGDRK